MQKISCVSLFVFALNVFGQGDELSITWYGQLCFGFFYNGARILIDPGSSESFDYDFPKIKFDYGFSTHRAKNHLLFDKVNVNKKYLACGNESKFIVLPEREENIFAEKVIICSGKNEVEVTTFPTYCDEKKGEGKGVNGIICIRFGDIRAVHLGGLGHPLDTEMINAIGRVDILMIPVDSYNVWDMAHTKAVTRQLNPEVIIPMNYKTVGTSNNTYPEDIKEYSIMFKYVTEYDEGTINFTKNDFGQHQRLIKLDYYGN